MEFKRLKIPEIVLIEPNIIGDKRGYFTETYRADKLEEFFGRKIDFCQDNESKSGFGVLRGLHFQLPPFAQTKLIRVIDGKILDVAVDIRFESPTFGHHICIELSGENKKEILLPRGFAHGFVVLSQSCILSYKVDNFYSAKHDFGLAFDDETLNIDWKLEKSDIKLSQKDANQPKLKDIKDFFKYEVNYYD